MRDKMKYHTMQDEQIIVTPEAMQERIAIYNYISQRSLDTGEQKVLLPLMNDILNGKHYEGGIDE